MIALLAALYTHQNARGKSLQDGSVRGREKERGSETQSEREREKEREREREREREIENAIPRENESRIQVTECMCVNE